MRSRYYRCRRAAAVAACLGSTAAIATLANAAPAMASITCTSSPIYASGSSFQNTAQKVFKEHWGPAPTNTECTKVPTSTYTATASGEGLEEFGMSPTEPPGGTLQPGKDPTAGGAGATCTAKDTAGECLDLYVGSDDAPTTAELKQATTASGGLSNSLAGEKGHRAAVVTPVAQGPLAFMISLPAGCRIEGNSQLFLYNETLIQLWAGKGKIKAQGGYGEGTWGAFLTQIGYTKVAHESELSSTDPGGTFTEVTVEEKLPRFFLAEETYKIHTKTQIKNNEPETTVKLPTKVETIKSEGCGAQIKAQVRFSESGTSYATKAYFNQIEPAVFTSALVVDAATWPEESWPVREDTSTSGNETVKNKKGSQLAENAAATPGSVGYADTADAAKGGGSTERATLSQRSSPEAAKLSEVLEKGEEENGTTHAKEKVFEVESVQVKSLIHQILYARDQNNGVKPKGELGTGATFAAPLVEGSTKANCETAKLIAGDEHFPKHWNESWNGTITSDPNAATVSKEVYPACAITYDVAWHHYRNVKLYGNSSHVATKLAEEMAATAKDYFRYMIGTGQTELAANGYYVGPPKAMLKNIKAGVEQIGP